MPIHHIKLQLSLIKASRWYLNLMMPSYKYMNSWDCLTFIMGIIYIYTDKWIFILIQSLVKQIITVKHFLLWSREIYGQKIISPKLYILITTSFNRYLIHLLIYVCCKNSIIYLGWGTSIWYIIFRLFQIYFCEINLISKVPFKT